MPALRGGGLLLRAGGASSAPGCASPDEEAALLAMMRRVVTALRRAIRLCALVSVSPPTGTASAACPLPERRIGAAMGAAAAGTNPCYVSCNTYTNTSDRPHATDARTAAGIHHTPPYDTIGHDTTRSWGTHAHISRERVWRAHRPTYLTFMPSKETQDRPGVASTPTLHPAALRGASDMPRRPCTLPCKYIVAPRPRRPVPLERAAQEGEADGEGHLTVHLPHTRTWRLHLSQSQRPASLPSRALAGGTSASGCRCMADGARLHRVEVGAEDVAGGPEPHHLWLPPDGGLRLVRGLPCRVREYWAVRLKGAQLLLPKLAGVAVRGGAIGEGAVTHVPRGDRLGRELVEALQWRVVPPSIRHCKRARARVPRGTGQQRGRGRASNGRRLEEHSLGAGDPVILTTIPAAEGGEERRRGTSVCRATAIRSLRRSFCLETTKKPYWRVVTSPHHQPANKQLHQRHPALYRATSSV